MNGDTTIGIVISVVIWIVSIGVAFSNFWVGFGFWLFSFLVFLLFYTTRLDRQDKQREIEREIESKKQIERERRAMVRFGAENMDNMTGSQFENMIFVIFSTLGYDVSSTPATGDYGADLIMEKDGKRIAVQAKRHSNNVGNRAVQEVLAGMLHYDADEGWVVTNSGFTNGAIIQARTSRIVLVDRECLMEYIMKANNVI